MAISKKERIKAINYFFDVYGLDVTLWTREYLDVRIEDYYKTKK